MLAGANNMPEPSKKNNPLIQCVTPKAEKSIKDSKGKNIPLT